MSGGRVSLYRHIYTEPQKDTEAFADVFVSSNQVDSNMLAANSTYLAYPYDTRGGGSFGVLKVGGSGKVGTNTPLFSGHKAPVLDVAFSPFNDDIVASASEDATIRLWKIEEENGRIKNNHDGQLSILTGHGRKVSRLVFNNLVNNALASFGFENAIKLWDISKGQAVATIKGPSNGQFLDINWSQDGNRLVLPAKDKKLHVYDVRAGTETLCCPSHPNIKGSRAVFYNKLNYIFTTGFSSQAARQIMLRDERNPEKPLQTEDVDYNAGIMIPFMDPDNGVVFCFGRGDTGAKYYELREDAPPIMALSGFMLQESIRAVALAPKTAVDTSICEIDCFYAITNSKHLIHLPLIVPRRNAECFQSDIYPETVGPEPSIELDEWKNGGEITPKLVNLETYVRPTAPSSGFHVEEQEDVSVTLGKLNTANKTIEEQKARIAELEAEIAKLKGQ
ncbi:Coronin-A [Tritrichomonas foetus]|uniref:Coronin n=1 Tax=Tritrichomonas foetus TaxID=1144522 RepID=A0A1J4JQR3_9EUKA|nr:Coronin-A [Tritrichomonas foetus]|eukprot:OHS99861.1 Coronin-A [Tritrichomonas foetus]